MEFINEFAPQPRDAAGKAHDSYPDIWAAPSAPPTQQVSSRNLISAAELLWQTFEGTNQERASSVNELVRATALAPQIDSEGILRWSCPCATDSDRLLAACTATLITAVSDLGWQRLGICAGLDCQDAYVDSDGRGRRRYCSKTCLNRARVRAYRQRRANRT